LQKKKGRSLRRVRTFIALLKKGKCLRKVTKKLQEAEKKEFQKLGLRVARLP